MIEESGFDFQGVVNSKQMKLIVEIEDAKASFFLELMHSFKDFVRIEQSKSSDLTVAGHPLDFVGIFNDLDSSVLEDLTTQLYHNRLKATKTSV
jgi:hypothetical protein